VDGSSVLAVDSRTRTRILDAALHHIALFGEDRVSISGVADEAGLSRGTVYRYFANREGLLDAIADHVLQRSKNSINKAVAQGGEPEALLRRVVAERIDSDTRRAVRRLRELQPAFTLNFLTAHHREFKELYAAALRPLFAGDDLAMSLDDFCEYVMRITVSETLFDDDPELIDGLVLKLWETIAPKRIRKSRQRVTAKSA
jgi:AcrR family transcriptional regulator